MSEEEVVKDPADGGGRELPDLESLVEKGSWSDFPSLGELFRGLSSPRSSGAYRRARLALERLQAPAVAVVAPLVVVAALFVVTATVNRSKENFVIEVASQQQDVDELDPVEEDVVPEDAPDMVAVDPDAPVVDVRIDVPTPTAAAPAPSGPAGRPSQLAGVQPYASPVSSSIVRAAPGLRTLSDGGDFGVKIGGDGTGGDGGGVPAGYMVGEMFDFKRDSAGNDIPGWSPDRYWAQARKVINGGKFGAAAEEGVYKVPAKVALNKILVPTQPADNGPKAFAVADKMKPRGWMAHYSATLKPRSDGRFRFIGNFDDFMACFVDGRLVLEANWGNRGGTPTAVFGWKSPVGNSPYGIDVVGEWFELKQGQACRFDICVGERPGGLIGGRLMIEKEGERYKMAGSRPVWPLFASRRLSFKELERIRESNEKGGFQLAEEISSLFKAVDDSKDAPKAKKPATPGIQVDVDI